MVYKETTSRLQNIFRYGRKLMKKINILDCTFRDGGYYTDWNFSDRIVLDTIKVLKPLVDVIELGFKSPLKGGRYRRCSEHLLNL